MRPVRLVGKSQGVEPVAGMALVEEEGFADLDIQVGRHALDAFEFVEPRWAGVDVDLCAEVERRRHARSGVPTGADVNRNHGLCSDG